MVVLRAGFKLLTFQARNPGVLFDDLEPAFPGAVIGIADEVVINAAA